MTEHESGGNISRRQLIKRGAVAGGAAIWVPPVIQSLRVPAHAQTGSPPPLSCIVDGFMTGGGFAEVAGIGRVTYDLHKIECPPIESPPELRVTWKTGKGANVVSYAFELLAFTSRTCLDDPGIVNGANATFDTIVGTGTGTLTINGVTQNASCEFGFTDDDESGILNDRVTIIVYDAGNNVVVSIVNALVNGGNLQSHEGNFAFGDAC